MTTDADLETPISLCDGSLERAFQFLGKRWNGVILAHLFNGPQGFSGLARAVQGISDSMLSDRLAELGRSGLVERIVTEGPPISVAYRLTESGEALQPTLRELAAWSRTNFSEESCSRVAGKSACTEVDDAS